MQWEDVPQHYRLEGSLKSYDRTPIELGFLISALLNYSHVLLLIQLALVRRDIEAETQLVKTAQLMLRRVIEALLLKGQLANSGTGLVWQVGLPIECLAADIDIN